MESQTVLLTCDDGYTLSAKVFEASAASAAIVVAPALGVSARFYAPYASYLSAQGITALTFDYRGSGGSTDGPQRGRDMRMEDWGRLDIDAALGWVKNELKPRKLLAVGHSAGAQLIGLAPRSQTLDAIVLVGGSAPNLRHYPCSSWPKLALLWYVLAPVLSWRRDDFPVRQIGLGSTRVAAGAVSQWARWARTPNYLFDAAHEIDTARYGRLATPLLSYCFSDDTYATIAAVDALLAQYSSASITRRVHSTSPNNPIGHFGYFRERPKHHLWNDTLQWLASLPRE